MKSLSVCIACYNRKATTLRCLEQLFNCSLPDDVSLKVFLLDDNSPDRTAAAVQERFPQVHVLHGDGQHYWAGGMRVAFGQALAADSSWYLWLNDDVALAADALVRSLATWETLYALSGAPTILVGTTHSTDGSAVTYGGQRATSRLFPWKFAHVEADLAEPVRVDAINGNFVLIPADAARRLGNIPPAFTHGIADFDYGLRAKKAGIACWSVPGFVGACNSHPEISWRKPGLRFRERLRRLEHPLGYPWRPRWAYLSTHFPFWAPLLFLKPYADIAGLTLLERFGRRRA